MNHVRFLVLVVLIGLGVTQSRAGQFRGLGGGTVTDVSADGSVVVGFDGNPADSTGQPWRWTTAQGLTLLPLPSSNPPWAITDGVSPDGRVVVGHGGGSQAWRWTAAGGTEVFGAGVPQAASAGGSVAVGIGLARPPHTPATTSGPPVRWTADGSEELLFPGRHGSSQIEGGVGFARSITPDGSAVAGWVGRVDPQERVAAFRWTAAAGGQLLGFLPGTDESEGWAISADGRVVVGNVKAGTFFGRSEAFRWTEAGGMVGLGDLPGGAFRSYATDTNVDGSVVVGYGMTAPGDRWPNEYFYWDQAGGMRKLSDVLSGEWGLDLTGWSLVAPRQPWQTVEISDDGTTIVGTGINPRGEREAWIAIVPEPTTSVLLLLACGGWTLSRRRS